MRPRITFGVIVALAMMAAVWGNLQRPAAPEAPRADLVAEATASTTQMYPIIKVVDGDTLDILMDGKKVRLRLIGLDTPEIVDPRKPVQCFARQASDKAKEILTGQSVRLETDPSQDTYDKYGRLLAYIFLLDGTNFNKLMIAKGYGHEYTYDLPYKYQTEFKAAEKSARESKKGLWADNACAGKTSTAQ